MFCERIACYYLLLLKNTMQNCYALIHLVGANDYVLKLNVKSQPLLDNGIHSIIISLNSILPMQYTF